MIDLERLAREADSGYGNEFGDMADSLVGKEALTRFAQLVAEEAAKIAERSESRHHCAAAIREAFGIAKP